MYHCARPEVAWLPDVTSVTWPRRGFPWNGGVRACNRKLRNIRPSGHFHRKWRHQTSPEGGSPGTGSHVIGSALGVWSYLFSKSYNLIIFYELALSLVICPFSAILFSWEAFNNYISYKSLLFSDMFEVLCSTPRVSASAFSLWYFY